MMRHELFEVGSYDYSDLDPKHSPVLSRVLMVVSPSISGEAMDGHRAPPAGLFPRAREPSSALSETSHSVNIRPVAGGPSSSP